VSFKKQKFYDGKLFSVANNENKDNIFVFWFVKCIWIFWNKQITNVAIRKTNELLEKNKDQQKKNRQTTQLVFIITSRKVNFDSLVFPMRKKLKNKKKLII